MGEITTIATLILVSQICMFLRFYLWNGYSLKWTIIWILVFDFFVALVIGFPNHFIGFSKNKSIIWIILAVLVILFVFDEVFLKNKDEKNKNESEKEIRP